MMYYIITIICGAAFVCFLIVPEWIKSNAQSLSQKSSLWIWPNPKNNFKAFLNSVIQRMHPKRADYTAIREFLDHSLQEEITTQMNTRLGPQDISLLQQQMAQLQNENQSQHTTIQQLKSRMNQLEKLLFEKNKTLSRVHSELMSERLHRQEFEKIRNLLDEQIIKERHQKRDFKLKIDQLDRNDNTYINRLAHYEEPTD